jgi:pyruvate dehydrogenase E2 component (dihydrolipoamide acetyltransferase)
MTESFQTPHFYMTVEADAQALLDVRQAHVARSERDGSARPTVNDVLVKMVAKVLEDRPALNCAWAGGAVRQFHRIHIGVATAVDGGLIVPVIRDANKRTLAEIAALRADIVQRTRERRVAPDEISGSTFTITNVGMWGIDSSSAIINPPEAAILAVGAIKEQVAVRDGKMEIRPMMKLTVSIDHRVLDGSDGAAFLGELKRCIEEPARAGL